jgi:uncharacterized FAD-dependent dehydrogenase
VDSIECYKEQEPTGIRLGRSRRKKEWRRLMISKLNPKGLTRNVQDALTALEEQAKELREKDSHFYGVEKRVII